jgi:hypothetical protein
MTSNTSNLHSTGEHRVGNSTSEMALRTDVSHIYPSMDPLRANPRFLDLLAVLAFLYAILTQ